MDVGLFGRPNRRPDADHHQHHLQPGKRNREGRPGDHLEHRPHRMGRRQVSADRLYHDIYAQYGRQLPLQRRLYLRFRFRRFERGWLDNRCHTRGPDARAAIIPAWSMPPSWTARSVPSPTRSIRPFGKVFPRRPATKFSVRSASNRCPANSRGRKHWPDQPGGTGEQRVGFPSLRRFAAFSLGSRPARPGFVKAFCFASWRAIAALSAQLLRITEPNCQETGIL